MALFPNTFDYVISLGYNCNPALYTLNGMRDGTYPFDWMGTNLNVIRRALETDFKDFLNLQYLSIYPHESEKERNTVVVINTLYGTCHNHDFYFDKTLEDQIESVKSKYDRKINRLRAACESGKNVLFIIVTAPINEVIEIKNIIIKKYPKLKFYILSVLEQKDNLSENKMENKMDNKMDNKIDNKMDNKMDNINEKDFENDFENEIKDKTININGMNIRISKMIDDNIKEMIVDDQFRRDDISVFLKNSVEYNKEKTIKNLEFLKHHPIKEYNVIEI